MQALLLSIFYSAGFLHMMRFAQQRGLRMWWVGASNYLVAFGFCLFWWMGQSAPALSWHAPVYGSIAGATFAALYFLLIPAFRMVGAGISQTVCRVAVVIPMAISVLILDPHVPRWFQWLGMALAVASLPLLTRAQPLANPLRSPWRPVVLFLLFALNGLAGILFKLYARAVPENGAPAMLMFVFGVATAILVAAAVFTSGRPTWHEALHGAGVGVLNVGANVGRIAALALMPGAVFFPTQASGTIVLTTLAGAVLWRERYRPRTLVGIAMAIPAQILIHLR